MSAYRIALASDGSVWAGKASAFSGIVEVGGKSDCTSDFWAVLIMILAAHDGVVDIEGHGRALRLIAHPMEPKPKEEEPLIVLPPGADAGRDHE